MYKSKIIIDHDAEYLDRLLSVEQHDLGRSSFEHQRKGKELVLDIRADDATAFKTIMNTLAKIFSIAERSRSI